MAPAPRLTAAPQPWKASSAPPRRRPPAAARMHEVLVLSSISPGLSPPPPLQAFSSVFQIYWRHQQAVCTQYHSTVLCTSSRLFELHRGASGRRLLLLEALVVGQDGYARALEDGQDARELNALREAVRRVVTVCDIAPRRTKHKMCACLPHKATIGGADGTTVDAGTPFYARTRSWRVGRRRRT